MKMLNKLKAFTVIGTIIGAVLYVTNFALALDTSQVDSKITIEDVVSYPYKYDGAKVKVEGQVSKVKFTKSLSGNPYTAFKLVDNENNDINVYTKGHLDIEKGYVLRIYGKFSKEKEYLFIKFKNVLRAMSVEILG